MMEGAADQKLANGGGGVPWGTGLPLVCCEGAAVRKEIKGGGCGSQFVLDSKVLPGPPAEEAIDRFKEGRPEGSSLIT